ncbi:putative bifunctional diguanylate cyclase/phosphodiesterase [Mesoaciditoga lauensis]|uniref:putative bifunctional diguanylate cyclase/phosphodiesterase n=1 Tax=Mesoaciditoga lauensis TaxID=1495039 RepID=UPI0006901F1C|nr:EAL domain-containing protein [Mesoaciditoga lauensis]
MVCREEKDYLLLAVNNTQVGTLLVDKNDKIIHSNKAANDLIGKNNIIGKILPEIMPISMQFSKKGDFNLPLNGIYSLRENKKVLSYSLIFDKYALVFLEPLENNMILNQLDFMAYHDELTLLPTRVLLRDRIHQDFSIARRNSEKVAILFLDLDDFKKINDHFSHREGNLVLQVIAQRLSSVLRESDTVSRIGGDEFVIVIRVRDVKSILHVVKKIKDVISQPIEIGQEKVSVSASIGISLYPDEGENSEELIHKADIAMYRAKSKGKGCYAFYDDTLTTETTEETKLKIEIQRALKKKEFELYYQPIVSLYSGKVISAEALIRWHHPERGLVLPNEFIPDIEGGPLIAQIGEWTIEETCKQLKILRNENIQINISVNISANHFQKIGFSQFIEETLKRYELKPEDLIIELTERTLMKDSPVTRSTISELDFLGVKISLDDFGTGYSNLKYLATLPINILKIDMSFIRHMLSNPRNSEIVKAIVALGKSLGILTVAEGVENEKQFEKLKEYKVDAIQGYYLSPSLKSSEFVEFVSTPTKLSL